MVFFAVDRKRDSDTIDLQRLKRREENSGNKSRCKQEKMGALIMFQVVKRDGELDEFKLSKINVRPFIKHLMRRIKITAMI